jgi:hypothetical protein
VIRVAIILFQLSVYKKNSLSSIKEISVGKSSLCTQRNRAWRWFSYLLKFLFNNSSANDEWPSETMLNKFISTIDRSQDSCSRLPHSIFHCFDAWIDVLHLKTFSTRSLWCWHVSRQHWTIYRINALTTKHRWRQRPVQLTTKATRTNELKTCCHLRNEWTSC